MNVTEATVAFAGRATLGEGSLWDVAQQRLYWVDIAEHQVCIFDPATGSNRFIDVGEDVGTVVVTDRERLLVALRTGLALLDPVSERLTRIGNPEADQPNTRFNDGKCDPQGRLWVGTMVESGPRGAAALYCLDADGALCRKLTGVSCSNGLCWSADGSCFYYVDTPTYQVSQFDFDAERAELSNRRVVAEFPRADGAPDGMTIDEEGQLWVALFGGGRVVRIDPRSGATTFTITVPRGGNVTSCAFGGAELDQLFITTARVGLSPERLAQEPDAGSLYVAQVPCRGVPSIRFAGDR